MECSLGRFGDLRLEKGGPFCWSACWRSASAGFGFGLLAAAEPARSASGGFCAIAM